MQGNNLPPKEMSFEQWKQHVDTFLQQKRAMRVQDIAESYLIEEFKKGVAPFTVATAVNLPMAAMPQPNMAHTTQTTIANIPVQPNLAPQPGTAFMCPCCSTNQETQRIEGLVLQGGGTFVVGGATAYSGGGYSVSGFGGAASTNLSTLLAPPSIGKGNGTLYTLFGIILLFCGFGGVSINLSSPPKPEDAALNIVVCVGMMLFAGFLLYMAFRESKRQGHFRLHVLPVRYQKWSQMYYCKRCAVVIDPSSRQYVGVGQVRSVFGQFFGPQRF